MVSKKQFEATIIELKAELLRMKLRCEALERERSITFQPIIIQPPVIWPVTPPLPPNPQITWQTIVQ